MSFLDSIASYGSLNPLLNRKKEKKEEESADEGEEKGKGKKSMGELFVTYGIWKPFGHKVFKHGYLRFTKEEQMERFGAAMKCCGLSQSEADNR